MPRVTKVKSARKDNPVCKKGETYYWWKFKNSPKSYSLTYPRPSQLTRSAYYGALYDLQEQVQDATLENEDDYDAFRDEITGALQEIGDTCQESLDNMPESLQDAPTGELLQERISACEEAVSEIENMEAPQEWQEIKDAEDEYQEWADHEPVLTDFVADEDTDRTAEEVFDDAHDDWQNDEPDAADEVEAADLSDMDEAIGNCHV